ncbi:MAG: aldehyde dehydrogenase family protein [Gammaproteobacteria bacterium]|nr:aldehyde dehydrogenase family protein [Gammaproteobacteria bacterium]
MYSNGTWVNGEGAVFDDLNPANAGIFARVTGATRADMRRAIEAAHAAQPGWAALPHTERARYLLKIADLIETRQQDLIAQLVDEAGSWVGKAAFEAGYAPGIFRAAAASVYQMTGEIVPSELGKVSMLMRQPLGVVGVISPWNFPLLLTGRGFATAMALGNTIVLKPSEESPVTGGLVYAELMEQAGLPPGVFNVVTCSREQVSEVGDELISNPHVKAISFTGSTAVGRIIGARAGGLLKKCCLELGGKDALLVLDDADLGLAVNAATFGTFMHQGQICMSVERIIVHESIAAEFTRRFVANVSKLRYGDPWDMGKVIGPIINAKQLAKIVDQVEDARARGARILLGGASHGPYFEPTVMTDVTRDMKIFREENFGPVAPILTATSDDEAIAIANDSEYGLSAGIITRNEVRGLAVAARVETGMAHVNDSSVNDEPHIPFGGIKNSGLGRHGGRPAIETFTELRWVTVDRGRHYPPPFVES